MIDNVMDKFRAMVFSDIESRAEWRDEVCRGKMFGVLIVEPHGAADRTLLHEVDGAYALFAYSGQILGRSDWPGYVPAIFDYLRPDGYFKRHESEISAINQKVREAERSPLLIAARQRLAETKAQAERETAAYKAYIRERKATRSVEEAQYQNAELRRIKQRWAAEVAEAGRQVREREESIRRMKEERKERSDALQRWLFTQHRLTQPSGEKQSLLKVFTDYAQRTGSKQTVPPSGTGECCAPRLLDYANAHGLKPLRLAEFWYGASPKGEIRHHGSYYEPCQAKCVPILWSMMPGEMMRRREREDIATLKVLYEDDSLIAIAKPHGMLSVPGRTSTTDAETQLRAMRPEVPFVKMVHRLDMDTSGILLAAKSQEAYVRMQAMFARHEVVHKEYVALVSDKGEMIQRDKGNVSLPLSADFENRPRQRVDYENGKEAMTHYEFIANDLPQKIGETEGTVRAVRLHPVTGRTHQLRVHCAHPEGLNSPIVGDPLYGNIEAERMYLHAEVLEFEHPLSGERIRIECKAEFV